MSNYDDVCFDQVLLGFPDRSDATSNPNLQYEMCVRFWPT